MKRALIVFVLAAISFLLIGATKPDKPALKDPPFGVEVTVQPSSLDAYQLLRRATPNTYTCEAHVTIPGVKARIAIPKVVVEPGGKEHSTMKANDYDVTFTASVDELRRRASTEVVISHEGTVILEQKSRTILKLPNDRIVPANE